MTIEMEQKERLDKNLCPRCGAHLRVKALVHDDIVMSRWRYCEKAGCGWDQRAAFGLMPPDPRGPFFLTQWEREDYERRQRGESELGPMGNGISQVRREGRP